METPNHTASDYNEDIKVWEPFPTELDALRDDEYASASFNTSNNFQFFAIWSIKKESRIVAVLSISRTVFVCIVLTIASIFFTDDANKLVLDPISRMLEKVKLIARDPLAAASDEVESAGMLSMMHQKEMTKE